MNPPEEARRKPCENPGHYAKKLGPKGPRTKDSIRTSAKTARNPKENLTLQDWITVFAFVDSHPNLGQSAIIRYFRSKADGALVFG
jgi:hypothetical protein